MPINAGGQLGGRGDLSPSPRLPLCGKFCSLHRVPFAPPHLALQKITRPHECKIFRLPPNAVIKPFIFHPE